MQPWKSVCLDELMGQMPQYCQVVLYMGQTVRDMVLAQVIQIAGDVLLDRATLLGGCQAF